MGRSQVFCGSVSLLAAALLFFACEGRRSPAQPTPPPAAAGPHEFRLSGYVTDTAWRRLAHSRVEVTDGSRAGTVTTTDEAGHFSMPGTFTDVITVLASKDGHRSTTRTVPPAHVPVPYGDAPGSWEVPIALEPLGGSADLSGEYTLTLAADIACTSLPEPARSRSYTATIDPSAAATTFRARLGDARFLSPHNQFALGVAGDFVAITSGGIVEQLPDGTFLVVGGGAAGSFGPSGIEAPLDGYFLYCRSAPAYTAGEYWDCDARAQCDSRNHQLTLMSR